MVVLLAGYFDEFAEKILVGGGKIHGSRVGRVVG
jgi:hypothetical protein